MFKYLICSFIFLTSVLDAVQPYEKQVISTENNTAHITLIWTQDQSLDQVQNFFLSAFQNSLDPFAFQAIQNDINTFVLSFPGPVKKDNIYEFFFSGDNHVEVNINGRTVDKVTNHAFSSALRNIL